MNRPGHIAHGRWLGLRKICQRVIVSKWCDAVILSLILLSTTVLCIDSSSLARDTSDFGTTLKTLIPYLNLTFAVLFTLEMVMKLVGLGLRAFLTDWWNMVDSLIVVISYVSIAVLLLT